jgi:hypothetical protein
MKDEGCGFLCMHVCICRAKMEQYTFNFKPGGGVDGFSDVMSFFDSFHVHISTHSQNTHIHHHLTPYHDYTTMYTSSLVRTPPLLSMATSPVPQPSA